MNQTQSYIDVSQSHLANQHANAPASGPPTNIPHYSSYGQPQALQPATHSYTPTTYGQQYAYSNGIAPLSSGGHQVSASMGQQMIPQSLPLPTMATSAPPGSSGGQSYTQSYDSTGQIAPQGMKPRVTATLWEDEGSLCFQVEANGVCVARREDNHFINGTKLLNVAGMTRGRRDGILKSEKTRNVVKIGPMHLKGVWITFERALDFANKEKITELLYPLFVHNIGALLYHPTNQGRQSIGNAAMAAASASRRADPQSDYMRTPQGTQQPSLTHHHSMSNPIGAHIAQPPHSIAPHPGSGRPGLDRAHTFPTPPTSASSILGLGNSGNSYEFGGAPSGMQPAQPLSIDSGMNAARSVPTTPATTPPGTSSQQTMQHYQTSQPYDNSRQLYSAPPQYPQYPSQGLNRYGQIEPSPQIKTEMAPPQRANTDSAQGGDLKAHENYAGQSHDHTSGEDAEGEHEGEYSHIAPYSGNRAPYGYIPNTTSESVRDPSHVSPEMTHSPHQNGSGRATPRTTNSYASGYSTPQRTQQLPSSNLYNVMSDPSAGVQNGADSYQGHGGYPAQQYPSMNGALPSNKRMREVDDQEDQYGRPLSAGGDNSLKRQRTGDSVAGAERPTSQPRAVMPVKRR